MVMKRFFQIALAACLLTACHPGFSVYDLRCEGLVEPLGIDNAQPHFSWFSSDIQGYIARHSQKMMQKADSPAVRRLREKLGPDGRKVVTVHGAGYSYRP